MLYVLNAMTAKAPWGVLNTSGAKLLAGVCRTNKLSGVCLLAAMTCCDPLYCTTEAIYNMAVSIMMLLHLISSSS